MRRIKNIVLGQFVLLNAIVGQCDAISDFNDGIPDWTGYLSAPFPRSAEESGGTLTMRATFTVATDGELGNSRTPISWRANHAVRENEELELRVDLVDTSHEDVIAGIQYWTSPGGGAGNYTFTKEAGRLVLNKITSGLGGPSVFLHEPLDLKHENVVLSLSLIRIEDSVALICRVLDKDANEAVLFERVVLDTPGVDPTVTSVPGRSNLKPDPGPPYGFDGSTGIVLVLAQITDGTKPEATATFDNLCYEYRPLRQRISPIEVVPGSQSQIRLHWSPALPFFIEEALSLEGPWILNTEPINEAADGSREAIIPISPSDPRKFFRLRL